MPHHIKWPLVTGQDFGSIASKELEKGAEDRKRSGRILEQCGQWTVSSLCRITAGGTCLKMLRDAKSKVTGCHSSHRVTCSKTSLIALSNFPWGTVTVAKNAHLLN